MKLFQKLGQGVNKVGGFVAESGVNVASNLVAKKYPKTGEYLKDVGDTVIHSSKTVISNTSQFADGAATGAYGLLKKDGEKKEEGWNDVKGATTKTAKGLVGGLAYTGKSIGQTAQGVIRKDKDQMIEGMKKVGKVVATGAVGIGVLDLVIDSDVGHAAELETQNAHLEGTSHPVTGVAFEKQVYETDTNGTYSGVFPQFDAAYEVRLPEETYTMSDTIHIGIANMELYEAIQQNPDLAIELGFDQQAVENLQSSITPEGYDWHHHEEAGRMQLVDEEQHSQTGHTGGRSIWGGGSEMR